MVFDYLNSTALYKHQQSLLLQLTLTSAEPQILSAAHNCSYHSSLDLYYQSKLELLLFYVIGIDNFEYLG